MLIIVKVNTGQEDPATTTVIVTGPGGAVFRIVNVLVLLLKLM